MNYTRNMKQTATYWAPGALDGYGNVSFAAPVEVKVRWQDKSELFRGDDAQEYTSSAVVYPAQELEKKGYLYLGSSVVADPRDVEGSREIRQKGASPALKNDRTLQKVWL